MYYHANTPTGGAKPSASALEKRFIKMGHTCLGVSEGRSLTLTGADQHDSLLWSRQTGNPKGTAHRWAPYGSGKPADAALPGFNGERIDPVSGTYHLGNGYRAYNSVLMRFNCPDSLSPFGAGGINPYAYSAGDPVNHTDPSGHLSWQSILGITLGAIGLAAAIFTGGMSIIAAGGVAAAISSASTSALIVGSLGVVADVTAIASGAVEDSDPEASSILGWVSLGFGLPGMITGVAGLGKSIRGAMKRPSLVAMSDSERTSAIFSTSKSFQGQRNLNTEPTYKIFYAEPKFTAVDNIPYDLELGYTKNFRKTGEPGLLVHGDPKGLGDFIMKNGISEPKLFKNMKEFSSHIHKKYNINLTTEAQGKKLHLIACYATGETGPAQKLANAIKAPVVSYGPPSTEILSHSISMLESSAQYSKIKFINKDGLLALAEPHIYYPKIF